MKRMQSVAQLMLVQMHQWYLGNDGGYDDDNVQDAPANDAT